MVIGGSIFLIVVGAIARYAVTDSFESVDLPMVGLILMVGGAMGLVVSIFQQVLWRGHDVELEHEVRTGP